MHLRTNYIGRHLIMNIREEYVSKTINFISKFESERSVLIGTCGVYNIKILLLIVNDKIVCN